MDNAIQIKAAFAAFVAAMTALWGWFGWLCVAWIACMAVDYISGTIDAMRDGGWSSKIARDGIFHKGGMVLTVFVALLADQLIGLVLGNIPAIPLPWDYSVVIAPMVITWYIITELGSIVENAAKMGAPVPPWLVKFLVVVEDATDHAGELLDVHNDEKKEKDHE